MKLNYRVLGSGQPLYVLHGLLGMLDNWITPGKILAEKYQVILVDQRNHGRSPHSPEMNYKLMMEDLKELIHELNHDEIFLIGHSMGGKTAMKFAQNYPNYVEKLLIADIGPKKYPVHHEAILGGIHAVKLDQLARRSAAKVIMKEHISEEGTIQLLLKNLYWIEKGRMAWRFNLKTIENALEGIGEVVHDRIFDRETLFLRGSKSSYILDEDLEDMRLYFPNCDLKTIKDTGHWVHAEKPEAFSVEAISFFG